MPSTENTSPAPTLTCGHPNAGRRGPNGECQMHDGKAFCKGVQR